MTILTQEKMVVSFSGGKTSGRMSKKLKDSYSHIYDLIFIFANTGQEREETLAFADKCDKAFGLNLVWIEAVVNSQHGKGITHKVVSFETASRLGEPFEAHIAKSGIPNKNKPQCSDRLKALAIEHYKKSNGLKGVKHAIGIRKDEEKRKSEGGVKKYNIIYPMCDWFETDKQDVNDFWSGMPFTLGLEEHQGNCATCWKKSDKKLWLLAIEEPEKYDFMRRMEKTYQHVKPNDDGKPRVFFRGHRSVEDIFNEAKEMDAKTLRKMIGYSPDEDSGCSESCNAYGS